jgi:beta-lactamase superfamily II metal-dependent hydrolase
MCVRRRMSLVFGIIVSSFFSTAIAFGQNLEIHYINVGWGDSVVVKGPDGTTVLLEAGNTGMGTSRVVPYLQSIGIQPANGLDYMIGGHQHCDHIGGLDEVIRAGYDVRIQSYYNGSSYQSSCVTSWNAAAAGTTASTPVVPTAGSQIPLGNGARLVFVAVNGSIAGGSTVSVSDENDRSIAVLVQYGGFDWLWASDLGGGSIDNACTGRSTTQVDVETAVIQAISPGGAFPLISSGGIDVLHVNHHGSESSTNKNWMNYSKPAVAIIATGAGQSEGWDFPRKDVLENVLLAEATACITVPSAFVVQSEEGSPAGSLTSFAGYSVGNIQITTDGSSTFTLAADGQVSEGPNEVEAAGLPRTFPLDDGAGGIDTVPPVTSMTAPLNGATVSGTSTVNAMASDDVAVARVEFWLDGALQSTGLTSPYSWIWDTTVSSDGPHTLETKAFDVAGNQGSSTVVSVTVDNSTASGLDISDWKFVQSNSAITYNLLPGTVIPDNGYVLIGRNATYGDERYRAPQPVAKWRSGMDYWEALKVKLERSERVKFLSG